MGGVLLLWVLYALFGIAPAPLETLVLIESDVYIVLSMTLLVILTPFFGSRAFCMYCPSGTVFGFMGRLVGQEITTNLNECISCGRCNKVCKMSIDVMAASQKGEASRSLDCVGCGLCVDICPQKTLAYTTTFTRWLEKRA